MQNFSKIGSILHYKLIRLKNDANEIEQLNKLDYLFFYYYYSFNMAVAINHTNHYSYLLQQSIHYSAIILSKNKWIVQIHITENR